MILFDALFDLAFILQDFVRGTATGGSTTTLIDTGGRSEPEDFFDQGTLFIVSGNNANSAPVISNWNGTTKTFTFAAFGTACAAGDIYAAIPKDFPKGVMVEAINGVLRGVKLPKQDATLVTVANQEAYTLPAGVFDVMNVEVATDTAAPYMYVQHHRWREIDGDIVFHTGFEPGTAGYKIRLSYNEAHAEVADDDDIINDLIDRDFLKWSAAAYALRWRMIRNPEEVRDRINEALAMEARYRPSMPKRFKPTPILSRW